MGSNLRPARERLALPVDALLPQICAAVAAHPIVLIEAEPGAGKTTRVPAALDEARTSAGQRAQIWVLEPRRLAARLAATRVADERGEAVGGSVGYVVRFDERRTAETRIVYATEGVLVRRLAQAPSLPGIDIVILDEFHERHLQTDLALALLRQAQASRPSLRLVLMSATLGAERLAEQLPGAVVLRAPGRVFPVDVEYLPEGAPDRHLDLEVASAVRRLLAPSATPTPTGDVLVFLPGAAEIRRAQTALASLPDTDVVILHGELSPTEQDRAVRPGPRRKVILSTNVAESSVTIEGVSAVVDSGLHRLAAHSPISGLPTLRVARIARSSAIQRAGRAGRTGPGRCLRLYTQHDFISRPADTTPEIERAELSELVLLTLAIGAAPEALLWVTPPPRAALEVARRLLADLGATDGNSALTSVGRELLALPLHPRLGRLIVAGRQLRIEALASLAATMLSEGAARTHGDEPTELVDECVLLMQNGDVERKFPSVARAWQRLGGRSTRSAPTHAEEANLRLALLTAFADRVGRVDAEKAGREVQLAGGQRLQVGRPPVGFGARAKAGAGAGAGPGPWLVALDAEERREGTQQRLRLQSYAAIPEAALLDAPACTMDSRTEWIDQGQRIAVIDEVRYGALLLDQERRLFNAGAAPREATAALGDAIDQRHNVLSALVEPEALQRAQQRVATAGIAAPSLLTTLGPFDVASLLVEFALGASSVREVKDLDLLARWLDRLSADERRRFEALAPDRLRLHAGRTAQIEYPVGAEPFVASRLQDFFGQASVPLVGGQPLTVHLLAPNGRPVQVTRDLPSFWRNQYPELRNALSRRYPRHAWPDDPLAAEPSLPTPRRRS